MFDQLYDRIYEILDKNRLYSVLWILLAGPVSLGIFFGVLPFIFTLVPISDSTIKDIIFLICQFGGLIPYGIYATVNNKCVSEVLGRDIKNYANIFVFLLGGILAYASFIRYIFPHVYR